MYTKYNESTVQRYLVYKVTLRNLFLSFDDVYCLNYGASVFIIMDDEDLKIM